MGELLRLDNKYLTVAEYAGIKRVSVRVIQSEIRKGRIQAERIGKVYRIPILNPVMLEE